MNQRGSPILEPSQSAPTPGKLVADQPGEPRLNRVQTTVQNDTVLYHRLKNVSASNKRLYRSLMRFALARFSPIFSIQEMTTGLFKAYKGAI